MRWQIRSWVFEVFFYKDDELRLKGLAFDFFYLPPTRYKIRKWTTIYSYHLILLVWKYTVNFELRKIADNG